MKKIITYFTVIFLCPVSCVSAFAQEEPAGTPAPVFSVERGFYETAFSVTLSATDAETTVYYTTDGVRPTAASHVYSGAITIDRTTPLSAVGIKNGTASPIVTHTYFFINDIVNQPANPSGYPDRWGPLNYGVAGYAAGENAPADYEMDADVCNNPAYQNLIPQAFKAIPAISIVTNKDYIFSHSTDPDTGGIYIYTGDTGNPSANGGGKLGAEWERPASVEFYNPADGKQFQMECGLRLHGGNSRKPYNTGKHSFRISFRKEYGEGKLRVPLFDEPTETNRFDHLVLRAGYNYSWTKNTDEQLLNAQYVYDSFAKQSQIDMGHIACHDRFVHLFINGLYWGLYDLSEKINDNFMDSYLGGADADYDVVNDDGLVDGDLTAYNEMLALAKNGKYDELLTKKLLDMENFIDYMLVNFYIGNNDWGSNNWFTGRSRVNPNKGFLFFCWDAETSFTDVNINKINSLTGAIRDIFNGLMQNESFKKLAGERVGRHFTGSGALTPAKSAERYETLCNEIDLPIILESARWGDFRKDVMPHGSKRILYTRNDHWLPRKQYLLDNYFPNRSGIVLAQLSDIGITPIVSGIDNTESRIAVYYADGNLYCILPESGNISIDIFSIDGKSVYSRKYNRQTGGLHAEPLQLAEAGAYIYRLQCNKTVYKGKLIKK